MASLAEGKRQTNEMEVHSETADLDAAGSNPVTHPMFSQTVPLSALGHIRAVPPSAAQGLKQGGRVGITIGLRLNQVNHG